MAAIINRALAMHQTKHIESEQDLDTFNKTARALKYTPYVDIALSVIFAVGSMLAASAGLLGVGTTLLVLGWVFFISGSVLLNTRDSFQDVVRTTNNLWKTRVELDRRLRKIA